MQNSNTEYKDITEIMSDKEKSIFLLPQDKLMDESKDGNIYYDLQCGMIVNVHSCGYEKRVFIIALDRETRQFTGTPVASNPCEGAIGVGQSELEIETGKGNSRKLKVIHYIRTDRIDTYQYDDIISYNEAGTVPIITYMKVMDKVMDFIQYDKVYEEYEKSKLSYTYDDYVEEMKLEMKNIPRKAKQVIVDPKALLIQNMRKEYTKLCGELETAKKYKETSKNELKQVKQNYQELKKDYDSQKAENTNLVLNAEKALKEKEEIKIKYQTLMEKYAETENNSELKNENERLKESLIDTERKLKDATAQIDQYKIDIASKEQEIKKCDSMKSSLSTSEMSIRQLTKNINELKKEIADHKTEITKRDKTIKDLQNKAVKTGSDTTNEDLHTEVERLKEKLAQKNRPIREYTLTPSDNNEQISKETIAIPSIIGYRLRKLMAPVPDELKVAFMIQMISYFEESIKDGDITVNMVTKYTL